jgi:hypothetical protein
MRKTIDIFVIINLFNIVAIKWFDLFSISNVRLHYQAGKKRRRREPLILDNND